MKEIHSDISINLRNSFYSIDRTLILELGMPFYANLNIDLDINLSVNLNQSLKNIL